MDPLDQPLSDLIGHELQISGSCGCTRVKDFSPQSLMERLGAGVTLRSAMAKLKCPTCKQRPKLTVRRTWGTSEGRDRRVNPPPLPEWVVGLIVD